MIMVPNIIMIPFTIFLNHQSIDFIDIVFVKRYLKVSCYEYRKIVQERILSNGKIEKVRTTDLSRKLEKIL